jgi:hypothetical protein
MSDLAIVLCVGFVCVTALLIAYTVLQQSNNRNGDKR